MSSLSAVEKRQLEKLFGMSSGYVLNFSNSTFADLFIDVAGIDIHSESYIARGASKANKLREFWRREPDPLVGKILLALIEQWTLLPSNPEDRAQADRCKEIADRLLSGGPDFIPLKETANEYNADYLAEQIKRIEKSIDTDPALVIGTAKELIETCCKTILNERKVSFEGTANISTLTKTVYKALKLVPEGVPENAKGAKTIKILLSNLATIPQGLAELRGLYGTGHGKDGKAKGLTPRHAKLAAGAAITVVSFLFDSHKEII
jgi:hypothetical protein